MAYTQTAPCVNINDEFVQVVSIGVSEGEFVKSGAVIGAVETDKSLVDVVAERDGYVLKIACSPQDKVRVGSVLFWFGDAADELVPVAVDTEARATGAAGPPTAKARAMLKALELDATRIPFSGDRLTVADIEAWLSSDRGEVRAGQPASGTTPEAMPSQPGELHDLAPEESGMLHTVLWHRDHAAAAYLELEYDPAPWEQYAASYATQHKLILSPLLPLMAWRLAQLGRDGAKINATIANARRYQYRAVNLGFTVQVGPTLYLTVVRDCQAMEVSRFIGSLAEVQRRAMAHKLGPQDASGATLSFSSMSRWNVSRHIPILPPNTSLIVAHAAAKNSGKASLGATYDHRLLTGFDVVQILQTLSRPPVEPSTPHKDATQ